MPDPTAPDVTALELQVGFKAPDAEPEIQDVIREVVSTEAMKFGAAVADELERRGVEHVTVKRIDGD